MKKSIILFSIIFAIPQIIFAKKQEVASINSTKFTLLHNAAESDFIEANSINPDLAMLRMCQSGHKWRNMLGMNFELMQFTTNKINLGLHINPFIEIIDFRKNQDMSWESWRGHLGANLYGEYKPLNKLVHKNFHAIFGLGYHHESQHIVNQYYYLNNYLMYYPYNDNLGNIRTSEYWEFSLLFKQKVSTKINAFSNTIFKIYPKPLAYPANYDLKKSICQEIGIKLKVNPSINLYSSIYVEKIKNTFESTHIVSNTKPLDYGFYTNWYHQPFKYTH